MELNGYLWICMDMYGYQWIYIFGLVWISMDMDPTRRPVRMLSLREQKMSESKFVYSTQDLELVVPPISRRTLGLPYWEDLGSVD